MYHRLLKKPLQNKFSFFLFGPRGTGKSYWLKNEIKDALTFNLLEPKTRIELSTKPELLELQIPPHYKNWIIVDEIQKAPLLLDLIHKLIEEKKYKFILTSSSARKLKKIGTNLLAGRAHTYHMYPLTFQEVRNDFDLGKSLNFGMLPKIYDDNFSQAKKYLSSYAETYLYEEVMQEGLSRNLKAFSRFLESASFAQGSVLNISSVANDIGINSRTVSNYFDLLEDMLLSYRIPMFTRRAKRKLISHPKFYFFDVGVYQSIRPKGLIDSNAEIEGVALETLILQELIALNDYDELDYKINYWRTVAGHEIDFILYGPKNFLAIEVKRSKNISSSDLKNMQVFLEDYPEAKGYIVYGGNKRLYLREKIEALPFLDFFKLLPQILKNN